MRAIQISSFGEPSEVLNLVDVPEPDKVGPGQVIISIEYAPVNVHDFYVIRGQFPYRPELPGAVGNEGVGRVVAVGDGVTNVAAGDRVLAPLYSFTWRERLVVSAEGLFPLPEAADVKQLSMLGINPPTAGLMLSEYADLEPGDWVVQNAANSGVGRSVIALAKARGFRTINYVRKPELIDELKAAGADVVLLDEAASVEEAKKVVGDGHVKLAIDAVSGEASSRLVQTLGEDAVSVGFALMSGQPVSVNMLDLIFKRTLMRGFFLNYPENEPKIPAVLRESAELVASGALHVPIAAVYPMEEFKEAVAHTLRGGKVLLHVGGAK